MHICSGIETKSESILLKNLPNIPSQTSLLFPIIPEAM